MQSFTILGIAILIIIFLANPILAITLLLLYLFIIMINTYIENEGEYIEPSSSTSFYTSQFKKLRLEDEEKIQQNEEEKLAYNKLLDDTLSSYDLVEPLIYNIPLEQFKLIKDKYLLSPEWDTLRKTIYKINNHTCQICNNNDRPLNAHHITYKILGKEQLNDLICICINCHTKGHNKLGYSYTKKYTLNDMKTDY